jgi:hypothetical protein
MVPPFAGGHCARKGQTDQDVGHFGREEGLAKRVLVGEFAGFLPGENDPVNDGDG